MDKKENIVNTETVLEVPMIIKIENLKKEIADIVSNSGLPAFILEPMFKDFYSQIVNLKQQELQQAQSQLDNNPKQ